MDYLFLDCLNEFNFDKKLSFVDLENLKKKNSSIKDINISNYCKEALKRLEDIESEIVHISFYNKLSKENKI